MYRQGLTNFGNTCYMNSTIQCLKSLRPFKEYLLKNSNNYGLIGKFAKLVKNFESSKKDYYLEDFINSFYSKNDLFKRYEQDDSYVFLISLLSLMDKESRTTENEIKRLFSNTIETILTDNYGKVDKDSEPSFCISLPITKNGKVFSSLDECLKEYQKPKEIYDSYTRKKYSEIVKIIPSATFLILNLQRISNGRHINNLINYPEFLEFNGIHYELMGLIKHIGDQYSGHKIALCKDSNSSWFEFNDNTVYQLSNQLPNENLVFLLFYQKLNGSDNYSMDGITTSQINEGISKIQNTTNNYNNVNSFNIQSIKNTHSITSTTSDAINLYKLYEKDKSEKEKNFYKLLAKKGLKNEADFLNINPSKTMKIYDFKKYFEISDVPDIFLDNNDINLFNLIYSYKNYYLGDSKTKYSKSYNKYKKKTYC